MRYPKISEITIPKGYTLEKTGCTQSLAHDFRDCPRKFLLKINRWHSKKNQEKFLIGSIVHDVLSIVYKSQTKGLDSVLIDDYLKDNQDKLKFVQKDFIEYARIIAYRILINYIDYYKDDFKEAKFTNTEREFAVLIHRILWRGKIDGEHMIKKDRSLYVLERKTKSKINDETITKGLAFDFQGNLYCKAKEIEFKKKVSGFIYDVMRIPQTKPHKNESLEEFSERLQSEIEKKPDYYFMRWDVSLSELDKDDFDADIFDICRELKEYIEKDSDIRNTFHCTGGISPCEYLDACLQGNMSGYYQSEKIFEELGCGL